MLEANDVAKQYHGTPALDGVSLAIAPGEVFCLLGANGAGKTTIINRFLGFTAPTRGTVRVKGLDPVAEPLAARRVLAYIPEPVALYPSLTGLENLEYFTALSGRAVPPPQRLRALLADAGLSSDAPDRRGRAAARSGPPVLPA